MSSLISLVVVENEPRVDSRLIADQLGVQHQNFRELIQNYQPDFEEFGILRFETGEIKGRGQPEKYVLLNEDQSYLGLTYTQNTPQARDLKIRLVRSFAEHRKALPGASSNPILAAQLAELLKGKVLVDFDKLQIMALALQSVSKTALSILEEQLGDLSPSKTESYPAPSASYPRDDSELDAKILEFIIHSGEHGSDHRELNNGCWSYRRATRNERMAAMNRMVEKNQIVQRPPILNARSPRFVAASLAQPS